ncbi:MAG: hypothetical protein EA417_04060 [Gammaproteobacteria bacterium]|nr:MAG: hypothetical protein EA417_04060 [Gammaproteobacteria bacterium]
MKTLLLTGFGPWDHYDRNAAWELLQEQGRNAPDGWRIRTLQVPVVWDAAWAAVAAAWDRSVHAVVAFGQAEDDAVRVERFAVNASSTTAPDRDGACFRSDWIVPGAAHALHTRLPWQQLQQALAAAGLPVRVSSHAGDYLCNHLFYRILHRVEQERSGLLAGFIHVPTLARLDLKQLSTAGGLVLDTVFEHLHRAHAPGSAASLAAQSQPVADGQETEIDP